MMFTARPFSFDLHRLCRGLLLTLLFSAPNQPVSAATIPVIEWTRLQGTDETDYANDVSTDRAGSVYIVGQTSGNLGGQTFGGGSSDGFISKFNASGDLLWTRLTGEAQNGAYFGVSADAMGNVFAVGYGPTNRLLISNYNSAGDLQWTHSLSSSSIGGQIAFDVSADGMGNAYVTGRISQSFDGQPYAGNVSDMFLMKFDAAGNRMWTRLMGTLGEDEAHGVHADGLGNIYMAGVAPLPFDGHPHAGATGDAVLVKFDASGNKVWSRVTGTASYDRAYDVITDSSGNIYITGWTGASIDGQPYSGSEPDAFVRKFDATGNVLWTRMLGGVGYDYGLDLDVDALDRVYIGGWYNGNTGPDAPEALLNGPLLVRFDPDGTRSDRLMLGSRFYNQARGLAVDGDQIYMAGYIQGSINGQPYAGGNGDASLYKALFVPEPTTLSLLSVVLAAFGTRRQRRSGLRP